MLKDELQDDNPEESSPLDNQEEDFSVSEDEETQDLEEEESETEEVEEEPSRVPPLNENPRFKELAYSNRQLKEKLERLEAAQEEKSRVQGMSAEEKAVYDLKKKHGFVTQEDLKAVKVENDLLKEEIELNRFLEKNPAALPRKAAIIALAYAPGWNTKSYEQIWSEAFEGVKPGRKVVKRTVKSGIKGVSSFAKTGKGKGIFTAAQIGAMTPEEYLKNEAAIEAQMRKGVIK